MCVYIKVGCIWKAALKMHFILIICYDIFEHVQNTHSFILQLHTYIYVYTAINTFTCINNISIMQKTVS